MMRLDCLVCCILSKTNKSAVQSLPLDWFQVQNACPGIQSSSHVLTAVAAEAFDQPMKDKTGFLGDWIRYLKESLSGTSI